MNIHYANSIYKNTATIVCTVSDTWYEYSLCKFCQQKHCHNSMHCEWHCLINGHQTDDASLN